MKVLWRLGKFLTLLFWLVVVVNLLNPLIHPFHLLIKLAGNLLLLTHLLELILFNRNLKGRAHRRRDRLQILLFGVFHLQTIPAQAVSEANHA
jgi:putative membrane protein